jgi:ATP-dependent Clp protease ATP-binding subunit ClpA
MPEGVTTHAAWENRGVFERFTDRGRRVLVLAKEEAWLLNHDFIGTEHIFLGLIHEGEGLAAKALESFGISFEAMRAKVREGSAPADSTPTSSPSLTPRAKRVMELSLREARHLGHNYIGTEHILLGLLREGDGIAVQMLQGQGVDVLRLRQHVIGLATGHDDPLQPVRSCLHDVIRKLDDMSDQIVANSEGARRLLADAVGTLSALARVFDPELVVQEKPKDS